MGSFLEYLLDFVTALIVLRMLFGAVRQLFRGSMFRPPGNRGTERSGPFGPRGAEPPQTAGGETARDPMCGMFVSTEVSHRLKRDGKTMHFCSPECLKAYERQQSGVKS